MDCKLMSSYLLISYNFLYPHHLNRFTKIILSLLSVVIVGINLFFVVSSIDQSPRIPDHWAVYTGFAIAGFFYLLLVFYIALHLIEALGGTFILSKIPV